VLLFLFSFGEFLLSSKGVCFCWVFEVHKPNNSNFLFFLMNTKTQGVLGSHSKNDPKKLTVLWFFSIEQLKFKINSGKTHGFQKKQKKSMVGNRLPFLVSTNGTVALGGSGRASLSVYKYLTKYSDTYIHIYIHIESQYLYMDTF